jgi:hypothetical protein
VAAHLKEHNRHEGLFYFVALAFVLLSAHGAAREDMTGTMNCKGGAKASATTENVPGGRGNPGC